MAAPDTRCKVVVRRLPPSLQEEAFKDAVIEWIDRADWFSYVQGKASSKELLHSRAYLRFKHAEDVPQFRQAWDGHAFVNERGTQFRCQVQFAPYQKIPRQRVKRDPKEGTLDRDADYQAFVERLKAGPEPAAQAEPAAVDGSSSAVVVTPLMQYLKDKRAPKPVIQAVRRGTKAQPASASAKGKASAGASDKKGKGAAGAAGKKGEAKQQAAVLTVVKQGGAEQQAAPAATAAPKGANKKVQVIAAKKQPAAGKPETAAPQPGILRRPAAASAAADGGAAAAPAAGAAAAGPSAQKQQAAAAEGSKKKAGGKQPEKAKGKQAAKQAKEPQAPGEKPLKVLARPAAVQQQDAPAASGAPSTGGAAAGPSREEAQQQRPAKAVRPGFGAYQPKAAGRLLQAALPQLAEASGSGSGSGGGGQAAGRSGGSGPAPGRGGGGRGRGRGRGRGQPAEGGGQGDA